MDSSYVDHLVQSKRDQFRRTTYKGGKISRFLSENGKNSQYNGLQSCEMRRARKAAEFTKVGARTLMIILN